MTNAYPTPQPPKNVSKAQIKRWRRHLADERMEARTYRSSQNAVPALNARFFSSLPKLNADTRNTGCPC